MSVRVWGIPCPNPGSEHRSLPYRMWFWLYANNQRTRHLVGLHQRPRTYSIAPRCDWCGYRSPEQREVARRNQPDTPGGLT